MLIRALLIPALLCGSIAASEAQPAAASTAAHKVVFQLQADDEERWNDALNNLDNLVATFGAGKVSVEVVTHGAGAGLVVSKSEALVARVAKLQQAGVVFDVCAKTCAKKGIKPEDLITGVGTVDSGVAHIVRRQEEGWSYLKGGG